MSEKAEHTQTFRVLTDDLFISFDVLDPIVKNWYNKEKCFSISNC